MFLLDFVCLSVCVQDNSKSYGRIFFWNFEGMSGMAQSTSDWILGVIQEESWILDHFKIFVTIALKGT